MKLAILQMVFSLTEIEIYAQNSHSRFVHDCRNIELTERRRFFPSPDFFQFRTWSISRSFLSKTLGTRGLSGRQVPTIKGNRLHKRER